jgi:hypothetical protein
MLGRLLPTLNESASEVTPSAETTRTFSTMPVTREASVPSAMIRLARETLPVFAASCFGNSAVSGTASDGRRVAGPWILPRRGGISCWTEAGSRKPALIGGRLKRVASTASA